MTSSDLTPNDGTKDGTLPREPPASTRPEPFPTMSNPPPMDGIATEQRTQRVRRYDGRGDMTSDSENSIKATNSNKIKTTKSRTKMPSRARTRAAKRAKDVAMIDTHIHSASSQGSIDADSDGSIEADSDGSIEANVEGSTKANSKGSTKANSKSSTKATKPNIDKTTKAVKQTKDVKMADRRVHTPPQPGLVRQTWQATKSIVRFPPVTYTIVAIIVFYLILGLITFVLGQFERLLCHDIPFVSWFFAWIPAICRYSAATTPTPACTVPLVGAVLRTFGGCHTPSWIAEQRTNTWGFCNSSYFAPPLQILGVCGSDPSQSKGKEGFESFVTAAISGARDVNFVRELAHETWEKGAVLSVSENGVRLLKNLLRASKIENKEDFMEPLEMIAKSLKPLSKKTITFRVRTKILSHTVNYNLDRIRRALQGIERRQEAREGQYPGRLIHHFLDPLHIFHTDLSRPITKEEKTVYRDFFRESKRIRSNTQVLIALAEVLESDYTELYNQLFSLDQVRATSMETVKSGGMALRNRNGLVKLWEKIASGAAYLEQERYDENMKVLQRVENYIQANLVEVQRCKKRLDSADTYFRLIDEEFDLDAQLEPDNEALGRTIKRIESLLDGMKKEAKSDHISKSTVAGIEQQ